MGNYVDLTGFLSIIVEVFFAKASYRRVFIPLSCEWIMAFLPWKPAALAVFKSVLEMVLSEVRMYVREG